MIHFQCACGRTLAAETGERVRNVLCEGCGAEVPVPSGSVGAAAVHRVPDRGRAHDFDAEIVAASRTRPPRPLKTPRKLDTPPEESGLATSPPAYDLLRVRQAPGLLGALSWLSLLVVLAATVGILLLLPGSLRLRCLAAVVLLVVGTAVFCSLQALREVCRALSGLADQQRGIIARLEEEEGSS